jgi:hypothetical protein
VNPIRFNRIGCRSKPLHIAMGPGSFRAGFRISTRAGLHRFKDHRLGRAAKKIAQGVGRNQSASRNENGSQLPFAH